MKTIPWITLFVVFAVYITDAFPSSPNDTTVYTLTIEEKEEAANHTNLKRISLTEYNNDKNLTNHKKGNHPKYVFVKTVKKRNFIIFARPTVSNPNITIECAKSSEDFPLFFSEEAKRKGAVTLAFIVGIYCFTLLAIICDKYFLPCVERICKVLNLSQDVAAATFMSVATSAPELFVNIIGTFITESDIGIGTIVGSSLFNALGVASLGGLAAAKPIKLDWWPLTRDVIIYIISVLILVAMTWDGKVFWYEALVLFIVYFLYFTVMFQNNRISKFVKNQLKRGKVEDISKSNDNRISVASVYGSYIQEPVIVQNGTAESIKKMEAQAEDEEDYDTPFRRPTGSLKEKLMFIYTWPIKFVLYCTVPNPQQCPRLYPITFLMCILWIGSNSYVVSWMISEIGTVFGIPDAVLGLTFLAAGGCLPEAISLTIMSRRGEGSMGVSNSLGANTMNILLSLGMPWFLKTISEGTNNSAFIKIESGSIEYTIVALIFAALILYMTLFLNKFHLSKVSGTILLCVYVVFLVLAVLSELVFFKTHNCLTSGS